MKIYKKKQKTAIITGASEGIGAAFSRLLIKKGWKVFGISRSSSKLKAMSKSFKSNEQSFKYFSCDVQDFKKLKSIAKEIEAPDLLLLNAGIYSPVNASEINLDLYKKHLNPVKCWYLELRHVLHFYNHSKRHRWIVEKFLDDEFKTDIITACEIDMYELYKKCEYWCEQAIEQKLQLNSSFRVAKKVMGELDLWKNKFNSVEINLIL